jgi:pyruvate/2-oxoglutarate dehydrogenase complex dihydrolipoamide dehydrogenase (E3) component
MVNPRTGMEDVYKNGRIEHTQKVLVVGGGVTGATSAIAAARHGHSVILCEKEARLGGQWIAASIPPGKTDFASFLVWQEEELKRLKVDVRLLTIVDEEYIEEIQPDVIIDATGSIPFIPPIHGIEEAGIVLASDVLLGNRKVGKNVAVIGGGMVGIETGEFIAQGGSNVTIFEMLPVAGKDAESETRTLVMESLKKYHVNILTSTRVLSIQKNTVIGEKDGTEIRLENIDTIVLAAGMKPNRDFSTKIVGHRILAAGDANNVKDGFRNIQEAYQIGWNI